MTNLGGFLYYTIPKALPVSRSICKPVSARSFYLVLSLCSSVAVGTALASGPPHGSVREEFPHTALTSGSSNGQPLIGIGMQNARGRKPVANQPFHVLPTSATKFLTAPS